MNYDQNNQEKVADFIAKMKQDYDFKKAYAARRAWEFYNHTDVAGMCYVAVGGLDSITLFLFLHSIGIDVPGTSVSILEDRSIQKIHKALGVRSLKPVNGPKGRPYTNAKNEAGTRNKRDVWTVSTTGFRGAHFAVFPEKLIEPCVLAGCPAGGTVLDPFTGSGTTGVVAKRLGRNFVGCEINPAYYEMATRRISETKMLPIGGKE